MPRIDARKICLIRTSALGDVVHALAMVNGLRKGYPEAHLTWILEKVPYEIVMHQPNIDHFIVFNRHKGFKAWKNLYSELRSQHFDLLLLPQVSLKAGLISLLVYSDFNLGFDWKRSRELHWIFTNRRVQPHPSQHVQDHYFEFLDYLEIKDYSIEWNIVFTDEEKMWRHSFFEKINRPAIAFVVSAAVPEKNWSARGYAEVMDYVDTHLGRQPLIVGGPSQQERLIAQEMCQYCRCRPTVALEKPIRRSLLQLSGSQVVVSPDTGPLHAAVAMNVPTVGLYGYSDPRRCGPYRSFHDLLISKYLDPGEENTPIQRQTRPGRMEKISAAEVIEKIELALSKYVVPVYPS
jgi:heptosyltransferase I